jgi:hypothetical protein
MTIEIDPLTGAPIVTNPTTDNTAAQQVNQSTPTTNDFTVKTDTDLVQQKVTQIIPSTPPPPTTLPSKTEPSIESTLQSDIESVIEAEVETVVKNTLSNTLKQIELLLKNTSMDSQQRGNVMTEITKLLSA